MSKVLVIEDNDMHLELASELLNKDGYEVLKASDAILGLKYANEENPDLILMDMDLPDMDGYQATVSLKENFLTKDIPVVALTALVMKDEIKKAFDSGCSGFIAKPIDVATFGESVGGYLKDSPQKQNVEEVANRIYEKVYLKKENQQESFSGNFEKEIKRHKILITDDNPMNAELLKGIMEQMDKETVIANSGKEALDLIRQEKFDLVLLDIMMPEISGFEVFKKINESSKNKYTPVLFVSALNETKDIIKGLDLGSYGYITKPFNIDELKARVQNTLRIKDLQDKLRLEQDKFQKINKFSADGIIILDNDLRVLSCSNQLLNWINMTQAEVLGKDFYSVIAEHSNKAEEFIRNIISSSNYCLDLTLDNQEKVLEINCSQIFASNNEPEGFIFLLRDVTEHKEIEKQKETFIATLTHDLKTPIRAEMRSLEMLMNGSFGELNEDQKEIINEILYSSKFMFSMVDTLLTKYKFENGNISLNKTNIDINDCIKSCYNELRSLIEEKQHKVVFDFKSPEIGIYADGIELRRLITNLFSNAITYTGNDGLITITTQMKDNKVIVSFKDNGKGIPENKIDTIFDKYVTYSKKFRQVGTGLGLYVSRQIVEAHNGCINVKSEEGKGSEFIFEIPALVVKV